MTRLFTMPALALCLMAIGGTLRAQQQPAWEIISTSEDNAFEYDIRTRVATITNGVIIRQGSTVLSARRVVLDYDTGQARAEGTVRIQHDDLFWAGDSVSYNFNTRQMEAEQFRTGKAPFFAFGQGLHFESTNHVVIATNAYITSDDIAEPAIKIRAQYLKIIPGDRIEARHAILYLGDLPIFYYAFYTRNLGPRANNFNFIPGYRSSFGPFLMSSYTWFLKEHLDGAVHVDYREKRGIGTGPDFNYHFGQWGEGSLKYYYLNDQEPHQTLTNSSISHDRQRVYFSYESTPATNLEVRSVVDYQGDIGISREFFEREYRQNSQPKTFLEVNKFWQNFSLDAYVQPRINNFFETVERLPDVRLTGFRQQIGALPVYYESESSFGYYHRLFADTNGPVPFAFEAARADTYHQLLLPQTFFGWLNFAPRVGGRFTYYSKASGAGATTDETSREVFNTGAELSFKASRLWPATQNKLLEIDGLRHIIEPSMNYVYVPSPNARPPELPQFDYELPSLRLLPIEFPDYNAIDSIDSQNVIRFGLRNKLQTKRQGRVENLLNWDLYTDWRLRPRDNQTTFADLYSDLSFKPRSWLSFDSLIRYDINGGDLRMALHTLTLQPNETWSWSVGHFYLRDDFSASPTALGEGSSTITSSFFYRLNENWGLRTTHNFDAADGRMQEQFYSIYRDFRSWTGALTLRFRDNRSGPDDFTIAFTFSLKAHPRYGVGADTAKPYSLLGS